MHLIQCTLTGPDGKDCVAWTSTWLTKRTPKLHGSHLQKIFALHRGLKSAKHHHHQITPILRVHFVQIQMKYGRRDNIRIFGVEEIIDEDVYERLVEVAKDIRLTVSKQDISVSSTALQKPRITPN